MDEELYEHAYMLFGEWAESWNLAELGSRSRREKIRARFEEFLRRRYPGLADRLDLPENYSVLVRVYRDYSDACVKWHSTYDNDSHPPPGWRPISSGVRKRG